MDNDGFKDAVVRYGSRIHIFKNPMKRNSITKIRIQGQNSMRNQFGRTVEIESRENSKKIAFVVDGGSGFMVSSNYDIFADLSELGRFQIRVVCREKILTENFEVAPSQILLSCE
jgi:23S rRNA pseudoU1915 N3-methylase RlmH